MDSDRVKGSVRELAGNAKKSLGDMTENAGTQAQGALEQVAGKGQDLYGQAKDSLQDFSDNAASYAGEAYDRGDHYARRGAKLARQEIAEYPLAAVLMAGAVGYLLAMALHGRR